MGPARLCLTQHVSLQTSEGSAQPGGRRRPRRRFAERRGCLQSSRRPFSHRGATKRRPSRLSRSAGCRWLEEWTQEPSSPPGHWSVRRGRGTSLDISILFPSPSLCFASLTPGFRIGNHEPAHRARSWEVLRAHALLQS